MTGDVAFLKLASGRQDYLLLQTGLGQGAWPQLPQELTDQLCHRRLGIGAVGIFALRDLEQTPPLYQLNWSSVRPLTQVQPEFLACASRYLFDAGRFGNRPIRLQAGSQVWSVEAVDSRTFRLELGSDYLNNLPTPLYHAAPDWQALRRLSRQVRPEGWRTGRAVLYSADSRHQLSAWSARTSPLQALNAVSAALDAWRTGLCAEDVMVNLGGEPYFVEIGEGGQTCRLTLAIEYVFSGTWSGPDNWIPGP